MSANAHTCKQMGHIVKVMMVLMGGGEERGRKEEQMLIRSTDSSSPLFNMSLVIVALI